MNTVNELKTVKGLVKVILTDIPQTRNSDSLLYLKVLQRIAGENDINLDKISVPAFLVRLSDSPFPPFESVRRSRQQLQRELPELSANSDVQEFRVRNEVVFREFSKGGAV
jgi:hypothetical protein